MRNVIRVLSPILLATILSACVADDAEDYDRADLGFAQEAICTSDDPTDCAPAPPPKVIPVPPAPTASATGFFWLPIARGAVDDGIDDALADYNSTHSGQITWRAAKLRDCGYGCLSQPYRAWAGKHLSKAIGTARLHYNGWHYGLYVSRDINIPVEVNATCLNWEKGTGVLRVSVVTGTPTVSSSSWIESVLNFLSNSNISPYIDAAVASAIGGSGSVIPLGPCTTLGVLSGYPSNSAIDGFVWNTL